MAERRKLGVIGSGVLLVSVLALIVCGLALMISGCRSAPSPPPGTFKAVQIATNYPAPSATATQPSASSSPTRLLTPLPVRPQTTVRPSDLFPITATLSTRLAEKVTTIPFATLDHTWPTPPFPQPQSVTPLNKPDHIVNILLLGNDVPWAQGGRTDSLIILSLNRETGEISLLSIPRDLYVVIPGWMMNKINLALPHGHGADYPGGGGALVKDTIRYNLGIPIDYYVRIGFSGFIEMVDRLGGVEIIVNCPIEDWRLRSAELNPEIEENWELFLLEPGVWQMDGELALWYGRSRRNSNDIDRGRRQQKLVRAILQQSISRDLLSNIPGLWRGFVEIFETDMDLSDALELALIAPKLADFKHLLLTGEALRPWTVPVSGEAVQLLNHEVAAPLFGQLMKPPVLHSANRTPVQVEVVTYDPIMYRQVADNLLWYGFDPIFSFRDQQDPLQTSITYNGANTKGVFAGRLSSIFRHNVEDIVFLVDDEMDQARYQVILGRNHNPCLPYLKNGFLEITATQAAP